MNDFVLSTDAEEQATTWNDTEIPPHKSPSTHSQDSRTFPKVYAYLYVSMYAHACMHVLEAVASTCTQYQKCIVNIKCVGHLRSNAFP